MLDEEREDNKSDSDSEGQCCEGEEDGSCHWFGEMVYWLLGSLGGDHSPTMMDEGSFPAHY